MSTVQEIKQQLNTLLESDKTDFQRLLELTSSLIEFDEEHLRFRADAGTIAQLGHDSIKDHTTAIIELVKNGYDADAEH